MHDPDASLGEYLICLSLGMEINTAVSEGAIYPDDDREYLHRLRYSIHQSLTPDQRNRVRAMLDALV